MYRTLLLMGIFFSTFTAQSQIKALTETGREVVLFDNGSWKYSGADSSSAAPDSVTTNSAKFTRPNDATFLVKSKVLNMGIYISPAKWAFEPHDANEKNPEYKFTMKSGDGLGMIVTEKTSIQLASMRQIALINARRAAPDAKEISVEYRMVNNKKVMCLKFQGTIKGIVFVFQGYYYSNANGTVQLLAYTSDQLFNGIQKDLEAFLNGLVEIQN